VTYPPYCHPHTGYQLRRPSPGISALSPVNRYDISQDPFVRLGPLGLHREPIEASVQGIHSDVAITDETDAAAISPRVTVFAGHDLLNRTDRTVSGYRMDHGSSGGGCADLLERPHV